MTEITLAGQSMSLLEVAAMLTGIAGVWLTVKKNIWCFPVGIINVSLYAWLFYSPSVKLYADALLQCIYILLLFYGWFNWKKNSRVDYVRKIHLSTLWKISAIIILSGVVLALFLQKNTDASLPWMDSFLTCVSLAAQWMIARKYIENWIIWIIADIIYIPLYIQKELPLTAILYAIFLFLAVKGHFEWKRKLQLTDAA
jgi:nicotinamide mononucleotide transporter